MKRFKDLVRRPAQEESSSGQGQRQPPQQPNDAYPSQAQATAERGETSSASQPQPRQQGGNSRLQFSGVQSVAMIDPKPEPHGGQLQFSGVQTVLTSSPELGRGGLGSSLEDRQEEALLRWINSKPRVATAESDRLLGLVQQFPDPADRRATTDAEVE